MLYLLFFFQTMVLFQSTVQLGNLFLYKSLYINIYQPPLYTVTTQIFLLIASPHMLLKVKVQAHGIAEVRKLFEWRTWLMVRDWVCDQKPVCAEQKRSEAHF